MFNRCARFRFAFTASLTLAIGGLSAASASATTTIGQIPTTPPPASENCSGASFDLIQPAVTSGTPYVVPAGGEKITSWSTFSGASSGSATLKVFRLISGTTYQQVGHDGPKGLTANVSQTFQSNVAVQPGDVLGISNAPSTTMQCTFPAPGETNTRLRIGNLQDGQSGTFDPLNGPRRVNLSAEVAVKPSNDFSFGKVKKNKNNGTALLTVDVPGPGTLTLGGAGVKPQRSAGATISKEVTKAGPVTLKIKAKGAKKAKLKNTGKVKVKAKVTFAPNGDIPVSPSTETKQVKLIDR